MRKLRLERVILKWPAWPGSKTPTFRCFSTVSTAFPFSSGTLLLLPPPIYQILPKTLLLSESPPTPKPRAPINPGICSKIRSGSDWPETHPWGYPGGRIYGILLLSSVQFSRSVKSDCLLPHGLQHARLPCPSPTPRAYSNSCPSNWWCHPTISSSVIPPSHPQSSPSPPPSITVFSNESVLRITWPKYWSFSFNISPSNEYSGLISFKMDWLDLFAVQGTLKSLLQHYSSKASFFGTQLSL